ncbi:uncharacterized protein LOC130591125 [Beta vulgaris subsp. vulgaris]|uniref:uncharacterized protein LOC130591125 n=1 Tax=Beta vulgaris subsp. vulgaris TaxID=3555 RepID=UPI002549BDD0|nr:uncharacterized protein LOC130591125 [Beta vulgaris subsp. vulgaris]
MNSINEDSDYEDDSDLNSPCNSDNEDNECGFILPPPTRAKKKGKKQTSSSLLVGKSEHNFFFHLGQEFEDVIEFRNAITTYCVTNGRDVKFSRNDEKRVHGKCKAEGCPWRIWASVDKGKTTFTVKTLVPTHNCGRIPIVKKIRASWIATTYHSKFKVNPYMKCQEIVDTIWSEYGVKTSLWLALKARRKAQNLILGEYKEQYSLLYRYAQEIKRVLMVDNYLWLGKGWNNQMFPIAWACVEVEDTESWSWFLELLANDLGTIDGSGYTIMSDSKKVYSKLSPLYGLKQRLDVALDMYM